jgi:tetratricopeptide (TPR) repeat protein
MSTVNKPKIFIGSSNEKKDIADNLQVKLCEWATPVVWHDVFDLSKTTIESLEKALPQFDIYVFLWTQDDVLKSRGKKSLVARDNLIFETGLSIGYKGRANTIIVKENGVKPISDLYGVTYLPYESSNPINVVATSIKQHYTNVIEPKAKQCTAENTKTGASNAEVNIKITINWAAAKSDYERYGSHIIQDLGNFMLDDDLGRFWEHLSTHVTDDNSFIFAEDFLEIADMCEKVKRFPWAQQVLNGAYARYPTDHNIVIKVISNLCKMKNAEHKSRAKKMMEDYFCISSESGLPVFTPKSNSRQLASKDSLATIFDVYLLDNEYDKLLSIIDSYTALNIWAKTNLLIDGYKAYALKQTGKYDEAISLYQKTVQKYPEERDLANLGEMFFDREQFEVGYRIYEYMVLVWFNYNSLLRLASKMAEYNVCRSDGDVIRHPNKQIMKKVIVPILFKAIELAPKGEVIATVKKILMSISGREEFDYIKRSEYVPQDIYNNFRGENGEHYDFSNIDYIEAEKTKIGQNCTANVSNRIIADKIVEIIEENEENNFSLNEEA